MTSHSANFEISFFSKYIYVVIVFFFRFIRSVYEVDMFHFLIVI